MNTITVKLKSVTYAIKARNILSRAGINAKIVRLSGDETGGCTHGVRITELDLLDTARLLGEAGIPYSTTGDEP